MAGSFQLAVFLFVTTAVSVVYGQISVFPQGQFVSHVGGKANFFCTSSSPNGDVITNVEWTANTVPLHQEQFVEIGLVGSLGTLLFTNLSIEYNNTRIRCVATYQSGEIVTSNTATLLLLQGRLIAVENLDVTMEQPSRLSLTWDPPFSLDIANVDPDIEGYCVNVSVANSSQEIRLVTECGITATNFTFQVPENRNSGCDVYYLSVAGVNRVGEGAMKTASYTETTTSPVVVEVLYSKNTVDGSFSSDQLHLTMVSTVCRAELTLQDVDTGELILPAQSGNVVIMNNVILWNGAGLVPNRHYRVTVRASNTAGDNTSNTVISTHGVADVEVGVHSPNALSVMTTYSDTLGATGVLVSLQFLTSSGDLVISRSRLLVLDRSSSSNHTITDLFPGRYRVLVYDVEQDQKVSSGLGFPAVSIEEVNVTGDNQVSTIGPEYEYLEGCSISGLHNITVQCTYSDSQATGFQVIVQQISDSSQVHKLYVEQTTHTTATVEVEETGVYQVSIFPLREGTGILDSNVEYTQQVMVSDIIPTQPTDETPTDRGLSGDSGLPIGIIIGAVLGAILVGCVVLVIVVLCIICVCPRSRKSANLKSKSSYGEEGGVEYRQRLVDRDVRGGPQTEGNSVLVVQDDQTLYKEDVANVALPEVHEGSHLLPKGKAGKERVGLPQTRAASVGSEKDSASVGGQKDGASVGGQKDGASVGSQLPADKVEGPSTDTPLQNSTDSQVDETQPSVDSPHLNQRDEAETNSQGEADGVSADSVSLQSYAEVNNVSMPGIQQAVYEQETAEVGHAVTTTVADKFPLLRFDWMRENVKNDLLTRLYEEFRSLSLSFEVLASAEQSLQDSGVTANDLVTFFQANSELTELANSIHHSDSIPEAMSKLRKGGYWNFLNYEVLESLIHHFNLEGTVIEDLKEYISKFQKYIQRRVCEVPVDAFDCSASSFPEFVVMLGSQHFSVASSLSEVKQLQQKIEQILNLKPIILTGVHVTNGCLQLSFRCFNALSSLSKEQISGLEGAGVLSLAPSSENQNSSVGMWKALMWASSSTTGTNTSATSPANASTTTTGTSPTTTDASPTTTGASTTTTDASTTSSAPNKSSTGNSDTGDVKVDQKVSSEAKPVILSEQSRQPVEESEPGLNEAHYVPTSKPTNKRRVSDGGEVIVPKSSDQASTGVKFTAVTSDTPEPTGDTPEPSDVTSENKFFPKVYSKVNPDEETDTNQERRRHSRMPHSQTVRTEGAMAGGQSPPILEPDQIVSNAGFRIDYPSREAGAGDVVEQDQVPLSPTTRQNSEVEVPPPTQPQPDPVNVQPSSPTTSEPSSTQDSPVSGHGEGMPPVAISSSEASEASEDSDSTAEQVIFPKSPTLLKDQD